MENIAFCGIDCGKCPAWLAAVSHDSALCEKTAKEWSEMFHANFKPEDILCLGCQSLVEPLFSHCFECGIRLCGIEKKVSTCAECEAYSCEKLNQLFAMIPKEKETMDARHTAFVESQKK
jgi:hypothetical protein